jgi:hypothetical protein
MSANGMIATKRAMTAQAAIRAWRFGFRAHRGRRPVRPRGPLSGVPLVHRSCCRWARGHPTGQAAGRRTRLCV